jgi:uncharacterized protein (TIGR02453 family)
MKQVFEFLESLKKNNNRQWFLANKSHYEMCHERMIVLASELLNQMNTHDLIGNLSGKKSLHRIYRDVRFSKDKTPYKKNWSGSFKRANAQKRGGYYYHLEPGGSFVAGGFWGPNKEDLRLIRDHLSQEGEDYRKVIAQKKFKETFGKVHGEQLKKSPKGFDADHPDIDLLRYKQFILRYDFADKEVLSLDFPKQASEVFQKMRPYFDLMSDFLTSDLNGNEII